MTNIDEALRESEERYRTLFEQSPVGVFLFDRSLHVTACNARFAEIMGSPAERLVGLDLRTLPSPAITKALEKTLSGKTRTYEGNYETSLSGIKLALSVRLAPLRDGRGTVMGGMGVVEDVTVRTEQEAALKRSELRFRTLIDAAPDAIGVTRNTVYLFANPAHVKLLGYDDSSEIVGRPVYDFLHPEDWPVIRERVALLAREGRAPPIELRLLRKDGEILSVEVVSLVLEFDGAPAVLSITRDITQRKRMQARLMHTGRMESIGTLAAGVAHEINNPLAYVLANLDVLARRRVPQLVEQARELEAKARAAGVALEASASLALRLSSLTEMVSVVREGAERVRDIVRDLRTFSRSAESERVGPVDVRAVLEASINIAQSEIRHRARLVKHFEPVLPVEADESRLGQVFLNLLVNAAQALPVGKAEEHAITVRTFTLPGARIAVEVSDTGPGIPDELRARIFDPFFTTKPVGVGTGLGLWICQGIVSALGGDITVESAPERGATFRVTLPARRSPSVPAAAPSRPALESVGPRGHVLVVDDEVAIGRVVRAELGEEHLVTCARSGREGLAVLEEKQDFDLVLCDLLMPDMTGMDLYETVASQNPPLAAKFVFVTGGAFTGRARDFLASVDRPVLEKPFELAAIRELLAKRLAKREAR